MCQKFVWRYKYNYTWHIIHYSFAYKQYENNYNAHRDMSFMQFRVMLKCNFFCKAGIQEILKNTIWPFRGKFHRPVSMLHSNYKSITSTTSRGGGEETRTIRTKVYFIMLYTMELIIISNCGRTTALFRQISL